MSILYLARQEIIALSSAASVKPGKLSPMQGVFIEGLESFTSYNSALVVEGLIQSGFLKKTKDKVHLPVQLESPFYLLNDPTATLTVRDAGNQTDPYNFFCVIEPYAIQLTCGIGKLPDTLIYPHSKSSIGEWFMKDFLKDISFNGFLMDEFSYMFTIDELIVLETMQEIYKSRVQANGPLDISQQTILIDEMRSYAAHIEDYGGFSGLLFPLENRKDYLKNNDTLIHTLNLLTHKGILVLDNGGYGFGYIAKQIWNPGLLLKSVFIEHIATEEKHQLFVNFYPFGALIGTYGVDEHVYHQIDFIPGTLTNDSLWQNILVKLHF